MLGRTRRTTRTDVALALTMGGIVYLAWALAAWCAKQGAALLADVARDQPMELGTLGQALVNTFTTWGAAVIDLAGPLWMIATLWMVLRASRQRRIISWSWLLLSGQALGAILIAVWTALAQMRLPEILLRVPQPIEPVVVRPLADWSPYVIAAAVLIWVATLSWLMYEAHRFRRGPAMVDAARTHAYRR